MSQNVSCYLVANIQIQHVPQNHAAHWITFTIVKVTLNAHGIMENVQILNHALIMKYQILKLALIWILHVNTINSQKNAQDMIKHLPQPAQTLKKNNAWKALMEFVNMKRVSVKNLQNAAMQLGPMKAVDRQCLHVIQIIRQQNVIPWINVQQFKMFIIVTLHRMEWIVLIILSVR